MIKIIILNRLRDEIYKKFKRDSYKIFSLIGTLKENPNKGKVIGFVGDMCIREIKYKSFRFYFILNKNKLNLFNQNKLRDLLIRFIEMSKKNNQQKTINKIKEILKLL